MRSSGSASTSLVQLFCWLPSALRVEGDVPLLH
jgi:hypothetical protein